MSKEIFNKDQYGYLHETFYTKEEARDREARIERLLENAAESAEIARETNLIVKTDRDLKVAHKIIIDKLFEMPIFRFILGGSFFIAFAIVITVLGPKEINEFIINESYRVLVMCITFASTYAFFSKPKKPKGGGK